ncbi:MAG: type IV toxin-antitoxin system AbiEi family antitoxin [Verrucomicrobiales bacterium]|jgi:hypothetical protein|nr:type IV toxin-antitoxin system AbiEi family antitoxin [Verrucomicrobiales bacterium]
MKPNLIVLPPRHRGAIQNYINELTARGKAGFSFAELLRQTNLSPIAAKNQLLRLGNRIVRITPRQGFFLIIRPEHQMAGAPPPAWWLNDYFNWLGHPYYLALQSAASEYGSNPQAVQVTQVITDLPRRSIQIGFLRLQFFVKRSITSTLTQELTRAVAPLIISTPETTVFDLLHYATRIGGISQANDTIEPLLTLVRGMELQRVLNLEKRPSIAQKLERLLHSHGELKLATIVKGWLAKNGRHAKIQLS